MKKEQSATWNVDDDLGNEFTYGISLKQQTKRVFIEAPALAGMILADKVHQMSERQKITAWICLSIASFGFMGWQVVRSFQEAPLVIERASPMGMSVGMQGKHR